MEDEKPFGCNSPGCGMRFTTADHLAVHQKKHEMALILNSEHSSLKTSNSIGFLDQTPTPTRFIRNCEEVGLFQDLQNVNPFDEHFRKAVEAGKIGEPPATCVPSQTEILNTPSVLPADLEVDTCTNIDNSGVPGLVISDANLTNNNLEDSEICENEIIKVPSLKGNEFPIDDVTTLSPLANEGASQSVSIGVVCAEVQDSSMCSEESKHSSDAKITSSETQGAIPLIPGAPDICQTTTNTTAPQDVTIESEAPTTSFVQLVLKLPDGQSVPVHMPPFSIMSSPSTTSVLSGKVLQLCPNPMKSSCFTKLKLREALKQNTNCDDWANTNSSSARKKYVKISKLHSTYVQNGGKLNDVTTSLRRKRETEENPDEKRKKFLERNRAAATRCRQKRKQWIQSLESKADELAAVNQQLQNEVAMLRTEVTHLKSMLLAHKDCPVTQQQQQKFTGKLNG